VLPKTQGVNPSATGRCRKIGALRVRSGSTGDTRLARPKSGPPPRCRVVGGDCVSEVPYRVHCDRDQAPSGRCPRRPVSDALTCDNASPVATMVVIPEAERLYRDRGEWVYAYALDLCEEDVSSSGNAIRFTVFEF
jgi:hypothetical protein